MSDPDGSAPAGWYPDPHQPGRLRYFDGHEWTLHYHQEGQLPAIGQWLNSTFGILGEHGLAAFGLAAGLGFVGSAITWVGLRAALADLAVVNEEVVNLDGAKVVIGLGALLLTLLWQGFAWLAVNRFLQLAHLQQGPTVTDAVQRALTRLPRLVAIYLALFAAAIAIAVIFAVVAVVSLALLVLLGLLLLVAAVWVLVKLSFLAAAVVAAPLSTSAVQASAGVSSNRFWAVLGRVLLLFVGIAVANAFVGEIVGGTGSPVDQEVLASIVEVDGDEVVLDDFRFEDLLPSAGDFVLYLIVSTVVGAASTVVTTSALMRLYLDSGAPSEI